jgi:hypothetical protein
MSLVLDLVLQAMVVMRTDEDGRTDEDKDVGC